MQSASFQLTRPKRPLAGWAWVLVLHALLFWAVHVGLTRDVVQKMPTVVQALLLSDTRPATPPPAAPPPPTPSPPPPTPQPVKPAPTPAPVAPPVTPAPAAELPAISTPAPTPTGLTASAPAAPPAAPPVAPPVTAAPTRATSPAPARTAAGVNVNQCEKPEYPSASRRLEEEGTVALRFLVGVDGKVLQSEIEKSSGFKRLDEAARLGLSKCQFRPALLDGKPEQAWASMKYTWRLE
ncbi:energy transducer TonB [Limnohabitans sp. Rim28]|uniref:energy transducer TonB n=1 Tax=Limnohabitans sp. Rim28 TaxID=1100720 RepID=UPI000380484A|nr:energy transducer TonB [Limnohabitans sp. Rim28]PVE07265.1 energy transducer TonB [Limnohabitans sp. Rim28]